MVGTIRVGLGEDQGGVRLAPIGDEDLPAVQHVDLTLALGPRVLVGGVRPGFRLRQREAAELGAGGERREEAALLLVGSALPHGGAVE